MARRFAGRRLGGSAARSASSTRTCRQKAFDFLARRAHFRRELEAKLLQRGYEADEVELTLVDLETEGYINDLETARYFIDIQLSRGPVGRRKLFAELKRRGADEDAVTKAVDERLPEDDPNLVREAADRWQSRGGNDPRALARHLERKGFPGHLVMDEVERLSDSD